MRASYLIFHKLPKTASLKTAVAKKWEAREADFSESCGTIERELTNITTMKKYDSRASYDQQIPSHSKSIINNTGSM